MVTGLTALNSIGEKLARVPDVSPGFAQIPPAASNSAGTPFSDLLSAVVGKTDQLEGQARAEIDGLMTGKGIDVHEAIIASEKASMAFELALAVRNKAVQSYQSVMSMQF